MFIIVEVEEADQFQSIAEEIFLKFPVTIPEKTSSHPIQGTSSNCFQDGK